ncbi:MAG TPA: hypothetical protein PKC19_09420 [Roseiflexaceae bacterium]|nr:hypothetical protein [Roseiflexaceae bacterium]
MPNLLPLLQQFALSLTRNFASAVPAQPEDQLKPPVKVLIESTGQELHQNVILRSESQVTGLRGRPDFGTDADGVLCGYIELKAPGLGARPQRFTRTSDNGKQWEKFKSLPNLIYTDGNEWSLFRTGEQVGSTVRLAGDVTADGERAITQDNAVDLGILLRDFLSWQPIVPSRPRELAGLLAPLCRLIRADVQNAIADDQSGLSLLAREWRAALFPDADDAKFADAYAQTLTYGLLLARIEGQGNLTLDNAANALDVNHGLLAGALRALAHPDARRELGAGIDVLLRILNALDPSAWHRSQTTQEDPWLYFYEDFLAEYDPRLRADAGVYYTPVSVIKAQVRLIDELLRTRFKKPRGFNAPGVTVLDPAAGTGAYPLAVLEHALEAIQQRSGSGATAGAATDLASRLHAFEFLVGPYAVAHLRLTQAVRAAGGHLPPEGALVYLSDTLESPYEPSQRSFFMQRLAVEHERARRVKQQTSILVCLGNPPYDRQQRDNPEQTLRGGWVRWGDGAIGSPRNAPLEAFLVPAREAGYGRHLKNLYNDYVYFWRWALWKVFENSETDGDRGGIVCFITASSYLRGPGFVGMRRVMRETFDELWILDLEGESRGARPTENVFNIQTGVAIAIGIRINTGNTQTPARTHFTRIRGTRAEKFAALDAIISLNDVAWRECSSEWLKPLLPLSDAAYWDWPELTNLFPWQQSGVKVGRIWPVCIDRETLHTRWLALVSAPIAERSTQFKDSPTGRKAYQSAPQSLPRPASSEAISSISAQSAEPPKQRYAFRSFDRQWILADARLLDRSSPSLWVSLNHHQVFLTSLLTDVLGNGPAATVSAHIPDLHHFSGRGGKDVIPLWRDSAARQPNITAGLLERLGEIYGQTPRVQDFFAYCYALLVPRAYVQTFADELLLPGPRVPLTRSLELFRRVAALGHELIRVHTFGERDLEIDAPRGEVEAGRARSVKAISPAHQHYPRDYSYDASRKALRVGDGEFAPVEPDIWEYNVSGLNVVRSWLNYRKKEPGGRSSSPLDEIRPQSWTAAMTDELLEVLWTLERTLELEPEAEALLREVLSNAKINAEELPEPTPMEREAPNVADSESNQLQMTL